MLSYDFDTVGGDLSQQESGQAIRELLHEFSRFAEVTVLLMRLGGETEHESARPV
jgi:hypothetical protein